MNAPVLKIIGLFSLLILASCSTDIKVHREDPVRQIQWSKAVTPHAMLSLLTYHGEGNGDVRPGPVAKVQSEMPANEDDLVDDCRRRLANEGWRRIESFTGQKETVSAGLYFEVWEKTGPSREVVFAFRGTDFKEWDDWRSNARWFRLLRKRNGEGSDQYDTVHRECLRIHKRLRESSGGDKILFSTTGHSLGGGLAQHVFYSCLPQMDRAIVFDTSPVTGYRDLEKAQQLQFQRSVYRETFPSYRILRIHEKGEVLEYVRNFTQSFFKLDNLIRAVEFRSVQRGNFIAKHSIAMLTSKILMTAMIAEEKIAEEKKKALNQ